MNVLRLVFATAAATGLVIACGSSNETSSSSGGEQAGQSCAAASECYPDVPDGGGIKGTVMCLTQVSGGYCTHTCAADTDCCAVQGECRGGFPQVCSPFTSTGQQMCFLSCEDADIQRAIASGQLPAGGDASAYCQTFASAAFGCRSSGGGSKNRKVCVP
jgi:hypothetical protein